MTRFNRHQIHRNIYYFGLAFLIFCLPLSQYLISVAQFLLALNWLAEGNFRIKARKLAHNIPLILFISVFFVYAAGYILSENKTAALFHIKNALPLLALPIIIGTGQPLGNRNIYRLLLLFCAGVITAAIACLVNYLINGIPQGGDFRQLSIFISHLRFAMMIVMAIVILGYFAWSELNLIPGMKPSATRFLLTASILFLAVFLFFLRSATGIVLLMAVFAFALLYGVRLIKRPAVRYSAYLSLAAIIIAVSSFMYHTWYRNFHPPAIDYHSLEKYTANGNPYFHDTLSRLLENGYYTDIYICESEMQREWDSRSKVKFETTDLRKQPVKSTLKRYLTSKGLRKDSLSVHRLTDDDIRKIEEGIANYRFHSHPGVFQRFYETLYEIHVYTATGFVELHSFGQRIAYLNGAFDVICEKPLIGTGTGDVYETLRQEVLGKGITVDPEWKGKPHNQFAFYLMAFGIPGLIWILFCWIYPAIRNSADILFAFFALIMLISMMVMDTHETYSTMAFFSLIYSLLIFGRESSSI